jgi:transglutaminase-like putative cysteine protease
MKIRFGYQLQYSSPQPTPMIFMLRAQPSAAQRLLIADDMRICPDLPRSSYVDAFGNFCLRLEAPAGVLTVATDALFEDSGIAERECLDAPEHAIADLPDEALQYLLPSRYCESDLMANEALRLFGHFAPGWTRVQAICDFVNTHVSFGYQHARSTKTALETYRERQGVCRDFAHVAIAFCRGLNIPSRYCTSYLGDIGVPAVDAPMDFAASIEVYLGGAWHAFDPRNNARRIGRLVVARGRDAADVAISTAFGPSHLSVFRVHTDAISDEQAAHLINAGERPCRARAA